MDSSCGRLSYEFPGCHRLPSRPRRRAVLCWPVPRCPVARAAPLAARPERLARLPLPALTILAPQWGAAGRRRAPSAHPASAGTAKVARGPVGSKAVDGQRRRSAGRIQPSGGRGSGCSCVRPRPMAPPRLGSQAAVEPHTQPAPGACTYAAAGP